jgi:hypothetical protein
MDIYSTCTMHIEHDMTTLLYARGAAGGKHTRAVLAEQHSQIPGSCTHFRPPQRIAPEFAIGSEPRRVLCLGTCAM